MLRVKRISSISIGRAIYLFFPQLARMGHTFSSSSKKLARAHSQNNALAAVHDSAEHLGRIALTSFLNCLCLDVCLVDQFNTP